MTVQNPFSDKTCRIGWNVLINQNYVVVDNYVKIGSNTIIGEDPSIRAHEERKFVCSKIGKGATIGANCIIYSGCNIGNHALIEDGSIVDSNVGKNEIFAGNPAKKIGYICNCGEQRSETNSWTCWCSTRFDK